MKTSWLLSLIATANEKLDDRRMMRRNIREAFERSRMRVTRWQCGSHR
jgi:hypothetical protein